MRRRFSTSKTLPALRDSEGKLENDSISVTRRVIWIFNICCCLAHRRSLQSIRNEQSEQRDFPVKKSRVLHHFYSSVPPLWAISFSTIPTSPPPGLHFPPLSASSFLLPQRPSHKPLTHPINLPNIPIQILETAPIHYDLPFLLSYLRLTLLALSWLRLQLSL